MLPSFRLSPHLGGQGFSGLACGKLLFVPLTTLASSFEQVLWNGLDAVRAVDPLGVDGLLRVGLERIEAVSHWQDSHVSGFSREHMGTIGVSSSKGSSRTGTGVGSSRTVGVSVIGPSYQFTYAQVVTVGIEPTRISL